VKLEDKHQDDGKVKIYFDEGFDAKDVIDKMWDSKLLPYYVENATDISVLLQEARVNPGETTDKYSFNESEDKASYNFPVKGEGKVIKANVDTRKRTIEIDLEPYDNVADFKIQLGPVIQFTSLRDATKLLSFRDFRNQLEFADISNEINKRIVNVLMKDVDPEKLTGKTITFTGAFTLSQKEDYSDILVTPILFEQKEGDK